MFKKQLTVQKFICLAAIIVSAILFVYSLGIMTDLYDCLYSTMRDTSDLGNTDVAGSFLYYRMQPFNDYLLWASIGMILLAVLLYITNTHVRRKYYIGNYVAIALFVAGAVAVTVWSHTQIEVYKAQWLAIDFAALKEHAEMWGTAYTESTFWFDVHYLVGGLLIAVSAALIGNACWKASLVKQENALLANGKEAAK